MLTRALVAGFLLAVTACATVEPVEVTAKRSVARLELTEGATCSGTMIAPSVLLTASHCLDGNDLVAINMVPVNVLSVTHDGADHALVTVDHVFPHYAPLGDLPAQGDPVFMYGNPSGRHDLFRKGYVSGDDGVIVYVDITIGPGDSGAAIFNDKGEVVGVVTGYGWQDAFHIGVIRHFVSGFLPDGA